MAKFAKPAVEKKGAAIARGSAISPVQPDSAGQGSPALTPERRQMMICEAAYYIAEHRGFEPGHDVDDWLAAEQEIDTALTSTGSRGVDGPLQR